MEYQAVSRDEFLAAKKEGKSRGKNRELIESFIKSGDFSWKLLETTKSTSITLSRLIKKAEITEVVVRTINKEVYLVRADQDGS